MVFGVEAFSQRCVMGLIWGSRAVRLPIIDSLTLTAHERVRSQRQLHFERGGVTTTTVPSSPHVVKCVLTGLYWGMVVFESGLRRLVSQLLSRCTDPFDMCEIGADAVSNGVPRQVPVFRVDPGAVARTVQDRFQTNSS